MQTICKIGLPRRFLSTVFGLSLCLPIVAVRADDSPAVNTKPQAAPRPVKEIVADIETATAAFPTYPLNVQLDARFRGQMTRELSGPLQRLVDLYDELEKADPAQATNARTEKTLLQVRLALYGHSDAMQSLTESSHSPLVSDALAGKLGLMMYQWWNSADATTQRDIVTAFGTLAKANPRDDMMVKAALMMARYHADSDELASDLRDIVDHDLSGPFAIKYHAQPYKLGRPFRVSVNTLTNKEIATVDWNGKVVLLDFWATWCAPCKAALPKLSALYQANHDKGLEILGISNDSDRAALQAFLASNKDIVWPQCFNPAGPDGWNALSPRMGVTRLPTTFLIDRNGVLRDIEEGYFDPDMLKTLLDEAPKAKAPEDVTANLKPASSTNPGSPADADEKQADSMLALAQSYLSVNGVERANDKLNELLQKFPKSGAAPKARELLEQLKNNN